MTDNRKTNLQELANDYHKSRHGDYDDTYQEFAKTYDLEWEEKAEGEPEDEHQPIPRYASLANDETYGLIAVFDNLADALKDQAGVKDNGETLNHPCGIVDLDTGCAVETIHLVVTVPAFLALCGLVQPNYMTCSVPDEPISVDHEGLYMSDEVHGELRTTFPLDEFRKHVPVWNPETDAEPPNNPVYYYSEAGV